MTIRTIRQALGVMSGLLPFLLALPAHAEEPRPGVIARGSGDVQSGGLPVARQGDPTTNGGPGAVTGSPDVFINGRPAVRVGDRTSCGVVVQGSGTVTINGRPMARTSDAATGC